jgi:serine phosphatase RsbU (regulator of sigma subunit)
MKAKRRIRELEAKLNKANAIIEDCIQIDKDIEKAGEVQKSILPQELPYIEGYDISAIMEPARIVGGDFYDFMPTLTGPQNMGIVMGDVTDKGLSAGLYMFLVHGMMHAGLSLVKDFTPEELLIWLNLELLEVTKGDTFITMIYGILDSAEHRFRFARAGHELPYLFSSEGRQLYKANYAEGQPLGIFNVPKLHKDIINIPKGGLLALYSDGLIDETDPEDKTYGRAKLESLIRHNIELPAGEICEKVMGDLSDYRAGTPPYDDCSLMLIRRL